MATGFEGHSVVDVTKAIKGIDFPVGKAGLVEHAQSNKADKSIVDLLQELPDQQYATVADVTKAVKRS